MPHPTITSFASGRAFRAHPREGFALLITVTLLAFLVLLLVSFAALTRVETHVAANAQQIAQARQNALMALNIAIGQLQLYAGPDQRTTARSDINATLANVTNANGRWTGVYGSRVPANYADNPTNVASKIATAYANASGADAVGQSGSIVRKGSQAILLNWLVSGNEAHPGFSPGTDVASDGHITLTESPVSASAGYHMPADTTLSQAVLLPSSTEQHALLVGNQSVTAASDRVGAPLVSIQVPESSIPGYSSAGTTSRTIGRYAWWVGDEGAKADLNPTIDNTTPLLPASQPANAFVVAQRHAVELVDAVNPTGSSPAFSSGDLVGLSAYNPYGTKPNQLLTPRQASLLDANIWGNGRKLRFHDLTANSQSLLTDTYAGGLKQDLSVVLATGATSPSDSDYIFPPAPGAAPYGLPTWGKLRAHVQTTSGVAATDPLTPRLPGATDPGLYPVLSYADIRLQYIDTGAGGIAIALSPRAVLWNPYTRPIRGLRYELGVTNDSGTFQLLKRVDGTATWVTLDGPRRLRYACQTTPPSGVDREHFMRFIIDAQESIPPGASYTYGLNGVQTYNAPYGSKPTNILVHTANPGYATMATGVSSAPNEYYRVKASTSTTGIQFQFQGFVSAYLGEDPDKHTSHGPFAIWPPDATTTNPWYQATIDIGYGGSISSYATAADRSVNPSLPYLQNDPDPYDDTSVSDNTGIDLLPSPGTDWWGSVTCNSFASRNRYLVVSNPRASFATSDIRRGKQANHFPGLGGGDRLVSITSNGQASSIRDFKLFGSTPENSLLYEFRREDQPLLSIGQLQHADLGFNPYLPAYLIGNANAPSFRLTSAIDTNRPSLLRYDYNAAALATKAALRAGDGYDTQYLVNRALWDRYFVSTVPSNGTNAKNVTEIPDILPNSRHVWQDSARTLTDDQKRDPQTVAAHLVLKGGFNINSTSEQAWRAVLGGLNQLNHDASTLDNPADAALPRFSVPAPAVAVVNNRYDWAYSGFRTLNSEQIAALAKAIVEQIRGRGPFVSMGDFINRRLRDNPDTTADTVGKDSITGLPFNYMESAKGTLHEAIDSSPGTGNGSINNRLGKPPYNTNVGGIDGPGSSYNEFDVEAMLGGSYYTATRGLPFGSLCANSPQFLTQADILSVIGPGLSARSDTFVIRTYGDTPNPVTGEITGRAWCEAVVQRTIDPVSRKSAAPGSADYYEPAAGTSTTPDFGRRFKIISFRWLSSDDI